MKDTEGGRDYERKGQYIRKWYSTATACRKHGKSQRNCWKTGWGLIMKILNLTFFAFVPYFSTFPFSCACSSVSLVFLLCKMKVAVNCSFQSGHLIFSCYKKHFPNPDCLISCSCTGQLPIIWLHLPYNTSVLVV